MGIPRKHLEWRKIGEFFLLFLVLPTIVFYLLSLRWPVVLTIGYYFIVTIFVIQAALSYLQSASALRRKPFRELPTARHQPIPKTTFIVCAYLPNEIEVIEATLLNILEKITRPADGIEVILSYNTPHMEGIEPRLKELAYQWPELILANAYGSRSKSENLNYALDIASGEMIVLLDSDHQPLPDCLRRAWRWLDEGYDVVQGRCAVRNGDRTTVSALVEVEFETMYGVSHVAKSRLFKTALFGGTNGYWRASVLKSIRFRTDRLTEDIDATLRTLLAGYKIVHDRSIVSTEIEPETLADLWYQRKRWAQGWFQCAVAHQWALLKCKYLGLLQRFFWTYLLSWRVIYDALSHFLLPILLVFWLHIGRVAVPMNAYIWFALIITLTSGPFETVAAYKNRAFRQTRGRRYLFYALTAFPYTMFKNVIQMVAIRDELLGKREWIVSRRAAR